MSHPESRTGSRRAAAWLSLALAASLLGACARSDGAGGSISDPYEAGNRRVHAFNLALDRALFRPLSRRTGSGPGAAAVELVGNVASNLDLPGYVLNDMLQFRLGDAASNSLRFVINTTIGVGGLMDVAGAGGLYARPTDFGVTMARWGVPEGNFVVLPVLGPSTERDAVGTLVDFAINPVARALPPERRWLAHAAKAVAGLRGRARYASTYESVLYESADSYTQMKLLYIQNRRFQIGGGLSESAYEDPYADPYAE